MLGAATFRDRAEAGARLGDRVAALLASDDVDQPLLVLGLPRGGVVVAAEVVRALRSAGIDASLDVFVVRKIGAPWQPELAVGAVADVDGRPEAILNRETIDSLGVDDAYLQRAIADEHAEALRRLLAYRGDRPPTSIADALVIVVDDGIATGATVRAALQVLRRQHPRRLILAVPVAPADTLENLQGEVNDLVCLSSPAFFTSVGAAYEIFDQTSDEEVIALLREHAAA